MVFIQLLFEIFREGEHVAEESFKGDRAVLRYVAVEVVREAAFEHAVCERQKLVDLNEATLARRGGNRVEARDGHASKLSRARRRQPKLAPERERVVDEALAQLVVRREPRENLFYLRESHQSSRQYARSCSQYAPKFRRISASESPPNFSRIASA